MIVFLHMHKAAGSSIIRSAAASGLRLPAVHQNGNLLNPDGSPIKYRRVDRDGLHALLDRQIADGVDFMAMEWDFPRWDWLAERDDLTWFTVLRDPLDRAISNFRMDKVAEWIPRERRFDDYVNGDALYCSENYYIKIINQLWPLDTATEAHLARAETILRHFSGVIVLEAGNMARVLGRLGIALLGQRFNTFNPERAEKVLSDPQLLAVDAAEKARFIARNPLDYALYARFRAEAEAEVPRRL